MSTTKLNRKLDFKAKTLFVLFLFLIIWQLTSLIILPKAKIEASDLTIDNITSAVNRERTLRNLATLNDDSRLALAAQFKADDMQNRHYFSHTDPEGNYIWNKIITAGYTPYLQLGENLAIEFYNTESLVSAWMNSPTHRANILNENFKDTGMGLNFGEHQKGEYYSSIANTFGALLAAKNPKPALSAGNQNLPKTAPKVNAVTTKAPSKEIKIEYTKSKELPKTPFAATTTPDVEVSLNTPSNNPLLEPIRSSLNNQNLAQNFMLPEQGQPKASPTPQMDLPKALPIIAQTGISSFDINRYLILGLGLMLVFMLISDLKEILKDKMRSYDKNTNNIVLLIISLVVIALLYWL